MTSIFEEAFSISIVEAPKIGYSMQMPPPKLNSAVSGGTVVTIRIHRP